ncbi:MAG TPA: dihydrodipicolinate reductase C-terminal domain-containing protein [Candidatus Limnocylindrales bacterium]
MTTIVFGDGPLGRAIAAGLDPGAERPRLLGRPIPGRHDPEDLSEIDLAIDASTGPAVLGNVAQAAEAGCRRFVIATTAWADDRERVERVLVDHGSAAVVAANFSLGAAILARLVEETADALGRAGGFEPFILEWHRRGKRDRPSGTALGLADRISATAQDTADLEIVSVRAGASPGMHVVGFDSAGETLELRLTARDRNAYVAGIAVAARWLRAGTRQPGIHPFDRVVDDLLRVPARRKTVA